MFGKIYENTFKNFKNHFIVLKKSFVMFSKYIVIIILKKCFYNINTFYPNLLPKITVKWIFIIIKINSFLNQFLKTKINKFVFVLR